VPTNLTGLADNVIPGAAAVAIASSTNATPIQITTTGPHGLSEGDIAIVSNHEVNTAANGMWYAHVNGSNTVILLTPAVVPGGSRANSVGNGVGAATGTIQSACFTPDQFVAPSAGDFNAAASMQVAASALADRTSRLVMMSSKYQLIAQSPATPIGSGDPATSVTTWTTSGYTNTTTIYTLTTNLIPGDVVTARVMVGLILPGGAGDTNQVKLQRNLILASSTATGFQDFSGTHAEVSSPTSNPTRMTIPLVGSETIGANTTGAQWVLGITGLTFGSSLALLTNTTVEISVYRQPPL